MLHVGTLKFYKNRMGRIVRNKEITSDSIGYEASINFCNKIFLFL